MLNPRALGVLYVGYLIVYITSIVQEPKTIKEIFSLCLVETDIGEAMLGQCNIKFAHYNIILVGCDICDVYT